MLNLASLQRLQLSKHPLAQYLVSYLFLAPAYNFPRKTRIVIEGIERIPRDKPVLFAMNHTDRYNNFPFQYSLLRRGYPCVASWVKGKYYENPLLAWFMTINNNIPLPSRGYVIVTEFRNVSRRPPSEAEYRFLRDLVDEEGAVGANDVAEIEQGLPETDRGQLSKFIAQYGGPRQCGRALGTLFGQMTDEVMRLSRQALFDKGLHMMVFPQGTRSKRLLKGRTGLAQVSQHLNVPVLPVGCNGSDNIHRGNSPLPRAGTVTYRVGELIYPDSPMIAAYRVPAAVRPLTHEATRLHGEQYQQITDVIMSSINQLLEPEYRRDSSTQQVEPRSGVNRFLPA